MFASFIISEVDLWKSLIARRQRVDASMEHEGSPAFAYTGCAKTPQTRNEGALLAVETTSTIREPGRTRTKTISTLDLRP